MYDANQSGGAPTVGALIYSDPNWYATGVYSNPYVGLTTNLTQTTGVYYLKITDNNGCEYGPFSVRVICDAPPPPPLKSYSCSGSSGTMNGYPQQYISPNTCYEKLDPSTNQPIPFGGFGTGPGQGTPAGPYATMTDCIDDGCEEKNEG